MKTLGENHFSKHEVETLSPLDAISFLVTFHKGEAIELAKSTSLITTIYHLKCAHPQACKFLPLT